MGYGINCFRQKGKKSISREKFLCGSHYTLITPTEQDINTAQFKAIQADLANALMET